MSCMVWLSDHNEVKIASISAWKQVWEQKGSSRVLAMMSSVLRGIQVVVLEVKIIKKELLPKVSISKEESGPLI